MPRKVTRKLPKIKGCPFKAGDMVRPRKDCGQKVPNVLIVTSVRIIPNITSVSYGSDVKKLPFWLYGEDLSGKQFTGDGGSDNHALWVGFVELDPFLGPAKRAVMEATDA